MQCQVLIIHSYQRVTLCLQLQIYSYSVNLTITSANYTTLKSVPSYFELDLNTFASKRHKRSVCTPSWKHEYNAEDGSWTPGDECIDVESEQHAVVKVKQHDSIVLAQSLDLSSLVVIRSLAVSAPNQRLALFTSYNWLVALISVSCFLQRFALNMKCLKIFNSNKNHIKEHTMLYILSPVSRPLLNCK